MQRNLKQFLDLIPRMPLKSCSVEFTYDRIQAFTRPKYSTVEFHFIEELEEYLALTFAKDEVTILSLKFDFDSAEKIFICLDILMGKLYMRNSAVMLSLEKLSSANLIGKGKLIEEVLIEF